MQISTADLNLIKSARSKILLAIVLMFSLHACDFSNSTDSTGLNSDPNQDPDPVIVDQPIAYIERSLPLDEDGNIASLNILDPDAFNPGAQLILKARGKSDAPEEILTKDLFPQVPEDPNDEDSPLVDATYDIKDLSVSPDGTRLLFAMRAPEDPDADEEEQPTWNIWEYDITNKLLERVIVSEIQAELGEDVSPAYLPNDKIVFSSNRQRRSRAIQLDENKPQYSALVDNRSDEREAFVLHTIDKRTQEIAQLTFNVSHDLQPTVLEDGRILFLRWDNAQGRDRLSFYTINPDGSNLHFLYGHNSQDTGTNDTAGVFYKARQLPDDRVLIVLRDRETDKFGGDIVAIDIDNFSEIAATTPTGVASSTEAHESLSPGQVNTDDSLSPLGYFSSAYPLYDDTNRFLVTWSQCRINEVNGETVNPCVDRFIELVEGQDPMTGQYAEANPEYGLWVLDLDSGTQLPIKIPRGEAFFTEAVMVTSYPEPVALGPTTIDTEAADENLGIVHIRNLFDVDGNDLVSSFETVPAPGDIATYADPMQMPFTAKDARFLRLIKPVPLPSEDVREFDNSAFGVRNRGQMFDILGYVPIEPDGSVKFKVPANIAFSFQIVDAKGMALTQDQHLNWLTVKAGETYECSGCHDPNTDYAHGRPDAELASVYSGAPGGTGFTNTVNFLDSLGTEELPLQNETMAEYNARINGIREPSIDLLFRDRWTPDEIGKAEDIVASYISIPRNPDPDCPPLPEADPPTLTWQPPSTCRSVDNADPDFNRDWSALCRITINYVANIQPIWDMDRRECTPVMVPNMAEPQLEIVDNTCTSCHNDVDAMGNDMIPAGNFQIELSNKPIGENDNDFDDAYVTSYNELFRTDLKQNLLEDNLVEDYIIVDVPVIDPETMLPVLDDDGNPVTMPEIRNTGENFAPVMNARGARNSAAFFQVFEQGYVDDEEHDHYGLLSEHELKLIAEWLDVGAQYYNNPFDTPIPD